MRYVSSKTGSTVSLLEQAVTDGGDAGPDPVLLGPKEVEVGSCIVSSKQAQLNPSRSRQSSNAPCAPSRRVGRQGLPGT